MRIALCLPPALEDRIARQAVLSGHDVLTRGDDDADALADRLPDLVPHAVVAASTARCLSARLLSGSDAVGARLIALAGTAAERRHAELLGLLETVDAAADWVDIEARAAGSTPPPSARPARPGRVIAVWGPAGAPGRTTIAIGLAAELAATGAQVLLADADTWSASIAPSLGLLDEAPGFAAACRLAGNDALTARELERVAQRYESPAGGFAVLTGIGRPSRWPELSARKVETTLQQCRLVADYTVVDVAASLENDEELVSDLAAPRRNAATSAALRTADDVIAVAAADPIGLARFLRGHVDLLETAGTDRVAVVVNKVRAGAIGLTPHSQIAATLARFGGIVASAMVPYDRQALDNALLAARTLRDTAPRSAARIAVRDLAAARILPPDTVAPDRNPRRRLSLRLGGLP